MHMHKIFVCIKKPTIIINSCIYLLPFYKTAHLKKNKKSPCSQFSEQLKSAIEAELRAHRLQVNTNAVTKVIQLYETKSSRHAVMIVGPTQAAKTVTWRVLQATLTRLNRDGDINYLAVKVGKMVLLSVFFFFSAFFHRRGK